MGKLRLYTDDELNLRNQGLQEIKQCLDKLKIDFMLEGGVLLGAVRDGNFIRWDPDVDLAARSEQVIPKMHEIVEIFESEGFAISTLLLPSNEGFYARISKNLNGYDLIGYVPQEGFRVHAKWRVPATFFEHTTDIQFLGASYQAPFPVEHYLEWMYGDWRSPKMARVFNAYSENALIVDRDSRFFRFLGSLYPVLRPLNHLGVLKCLSRIVSTVGDSVSPLLQRLGVQESTINSVRHKFWMFRAEIVEDMKAAPVKALTPGKSLLLDMLECAHCQDQTVVAIGSLGENEIAYLMQWDLPNVDFHLVDPNVGDLDRSRNEIQKIFPNAKNVHYHCITFGEGLGIGETSGILLTRETHDSHDTIQFNSTADISSTLTNFWDGRSRLLLIIKIGGTCEEITKALPGVLPDNANVRVFLVLGQQFSDKKGAASVFKALFHQHFKIELILAPTSGFLTTSNEGHVTPIMTKDKEGLFANCPWESIIQENYELTDVSIRAMLVGRELR
jgi:hypothetical protein